MKFYKITSEDEWHHRMHYQDGLNVDCLPFNPKGSCQSGGLYFSREYILRFLNFGSWVREVTLPEGEAVHKETSYDSVKWKAHRIILGPRRRVDALVIQELIIEGAYPHVIDRGFLIDAIQSHQTDVFKVLLNNKYGQRFVESLKEDIQEDDILEDVLNLALNEHDLELMELLLRKKATRYRKALSLILYKAVKQRKSKMVDLLLKYGVSLQGARNHAQQFHDKKTFRALKNLKPYKKPGESNKVLAGIFIGLLASATVGYAIAQAFFN